MDVDAVSKRSNIYGIIFIEWNYSHVSIQNVVEHITSEYLPPYKDFQGLTELDFMTEA